MRISVLGPLEIDGNSDSLGMRDRVVLAALSMKPGAVLTAEQLSDAIWGEAPPASAAKNLQGCVSRLRKRLGTDAIETTELGYRLRLSADDVDTSRFVREVSRAQELATLREWERATFVAHEALDLWRGRPLADLEEWEPAMAEVARLAELRTEVEELAVVAALEAGHHHEVTAQARALVEAAPLRERRWILLARAQYQSGRQAEALRTLRRARVVLREELGLDPGPDIVSLEQAILQQDPALLVDDAAAASESCPYPGLASYDEEDADSFFGRDDDVAGALSRIRSGSPLAVVGPSGSGKSSLVRAGIAPALRRDGLDVRIITPGRHPMEAISGLPPRTRGSAALVVDQAEEVFSLCPDQQERQEFLSAVARYAEHGHVVVCFRADRTGDLVAHPEFARLVEQGLCLLGPLGRDDLRAAIERPALQAGLVVEPGLVDLLVREVEGEPGALPLLAHALRETWLRREGRTLTVAGYQASGGVRGAVAQSAEHLYADTRAEDRNALRELMLRLVVPGPDGEATRARMSRRTVVSRPAQDELVDRLVAARLVTSDDGVVTLAHEAVVRSWPRLQGWLEDDVEGLRILHHLAAAADAWQGLGRPDSELYRGVRLERALAWQERTNPELTATERDFIEAGHAAAASAARVAADLARARGVMIRRLRVALVGAAVLLLVALGTGFVAVSQGQKALDAATAAQARGLSTEALRSRDLAVGALLAVEAVRLDDSPQTRSTLSTFLSGHPDLLSTSDRVGPLVGGPQLSPDGSVVAVYDDDNVVSEVDAASGHVLARYDTDGEQPDLQFWPTRPLAFAPDGAQLAVGLQTFGTTPLVLLDANTWQPSPEQPAGFPSGETKAMSVTFSGDGRYVGLAVSERRPGSVGDAEAEGGPQVAVVWDRTDLRHPVATVRLRRSGEYYPFQRVFLDRHGHVLYGSDPMTAYRVRPRAGQPREVWRAPGISAADVADLSPDGSSLLVSHGGDHPDRVVTLDARRGAVTARADLDGDVQAVDYAPRGNAVLVGIWRGSAGGAVEVLDARTLEQHSTVATQPSDYVQLSGDGTAAVTTADTDQTVVTWDLRGDRGFLRALPVEADDTFSSSSFRMSSPDGTRMAVFGVDGRFGLADLATGHVTRTLLIDAGAFTPGAWAPDGERFVLGAADGSVRTLDQDNRVIRSASFSTDMISGLDWSADGSRIAISDIQGSVRLVDADTFSPLGHAVHLPGYASGLTLAPDGRRAFVVVSKTRRNPGQLPHFDQWALLDLETGTQLRSGTLPDTVVNMADFSPDGRHVALALYSGNMNVLDTETGRFVSAPAPPSSIGGQAWLTYSADGAHVVTSDYGGFIRLWDPDTAVVENTVQEPHESFASAQIRPGTSEVWFYGSGTQAYVWDTRLDRSIDYACRMAGRDLTADEWTTYLGDREHEQACPG
ncbi:winged helix-turn-helix domain-containing protein [Nocardioides islandensis]|uniref:Winged helix-turn-helix domain-containing protein n=1 Tax=Nocardioides islandensis TaxID=433663 RepID=A0A930VHF9_9ACTN|nr:BTAD domain-containing putative transcriptional regulator [Nocardioides islandensis]MBF4765691.1 winged helix-turn-helix domain-containing protein [Nocardioides islandensis]